MSNNMDIVNPMIPIRVPNGQRLAEVGHDTRGSPQAPKLCPRPHSSQLIGRWEAPGDIGTLICIGLIIARRRFRYR